MALAVNKKTLPTVRDRDSAFERDVRVSMRNLEDTLTALITAPMPSLTLKGNDTDGSQAAANLTVEDVREMLGFPQTVVAPVDTRYTTTSLVTVPNMSFSVAVGSRYRFRYVVLVQTDTTSVGPGLSVSVPSVTTFGAAAQLTGIAADGTGAVWSGAITASDDPVLASGVVTADTDYVFTVEGILVPAASGTLALRARLETGTATVTVREGSSGFLWRLT